MESDQKNLKSFCTSLTKQGNIYLDDEISTF